MIFDEYFKCLREEQNLRKVTKSHYVFLTTPDEVENMCNQNIPIIVYISVT